MTGYRIAAALAALAVAGFGFLRPTTVTHADSVTISTRNTSLTYTHGPFYVPNANNVQGVSCGAAAPCDDYTLNVNVPAGTDSTQQINVQIAWGLAEADFDLYVLDSAGNTLASSATSNDPEVTSIPAVSGTYTVRVVPYNPLGQSFTASVGLGTKPAAAPGGGDVAPASTGIAPRFQTYAIPQAQGGNGGEPSIGANWETGNILYQASLQTLKVRFDDSTSPARATWTDISSLTTSKTSLDPILFTDHNTSRTFVSQLTGVDSLAAFTDGDGNAWTPSQGGGIPSGVDHQTIGGGPYSTQGGITPPNAGVPLYDISACSGIHGHVKVAQNDGTVYVPNRSCGGHQAAIVSTDNGLTWAVRPVPDSTPAHGSDPSIGIGSDGTVYFGFQGADGHARIAVSHDQGKTWSKSVDVGAQLGVQNSVFPAVAAGDGNRASVAYIGTTTGGNYEATASFTGIWHLYISTTYDGGQTWSTVDTTPNDPVQRGSICTSGTLCGKDRNLLDFMDMTIDAQGRVVVGYPDGCVNACVTADPSLPGSQTNSFTAYAAIARQSGGKSLFAANDISEPHAPLKTFLTTTQNQTGGPVTLHFGTPDNGGAALKSFQVFRSTTPDGIGTNPSSSAALVSLRPDKVTWTDYHIRSGATYYYAIRAMNSQGSGPLSNVSTPVVINPKPMCTVPGVTVLTDPTGDQTGAPENTDLDIQSVSVTEPGGTSNLVFTMKVASLAAPGPNHQWRIIWDYADGSGSRYYLGMNTDATGAASFSYGTEFGTNTPAINSVPGTQTTSTPALTGSGYNVDGTIVVVVPLSGVGSPAANTTLPNFQARTFAGQGNATIALTAAAADTTGYGTYTLVGNAYCQ